MNDPYGGSDLFSRMDETAETAPAIMTVSELTAAIRGVLELNFDSVWLEGEISGYTVAQSKHAYFTLKDDKSQVRCVLFRGQRARLNFQPENGDHVLVCGRVAVYDARGEYQVIVETMEPRGLGALQKAFEQLRKKLEDEGLFAERHKKPLPEFPWRIGVVTSPTGAAIRDVLNILRRRNPKVSVLLDPVKVQGEGAAEEIARAIRRLNQVEGLDLLIVGRGGGSIEDLWAFNEEVVARAIHESKLPIISAVGHEVDFTIADFVADLRAPTPSAAAELAVPVLGEVLDNLRDLTDRLVGQMHWQIEDSRERLRFLIDRRFFREPERILENPAQRLDDLGGRLLRSLDTWARVQREGLRSRVRRLLSASPERQVRTSRDKMIYLNQLLARNMEDRLKMERNRFEGLIKQLEAMSPLKVLGRGYGLVTAHKTGKVVTRKSQVAPGDRLHIRLAEGKLDATVDEG